MDFEVVVVGAGIGGLTVAALLAGRGVSVCVLERESVVGGCAANFDKLGYSFEQGYGLYACWQPNEIHDRVFSELPVGPPEVRRLEPAYVVRLPDLAEVSLTENAKDFEDNLREVFPECAEKAVTFYRKLDAIGDSLRKALQKRPDLFAASHSKQVLALLPEGRLGAQIIKSSQETALDRLDSVSPRFRRFIDIQLQTLAQGTAADVSYLYSALALSAPRRGLFAIGGGGSALASRLAGSIGRSGGKIRLDTPVLRLAYNSRGEALGVDLLSGERVTASKAIVSNLTVWDTYGKLVGLNQTPLDVRKEMKSLQGWGAYMLYLGLDQDAVLRSDRLMLLTEWNEGLEYEPENSQLMFSAAPAWDSKAPAGKRAVCVHAFTQVDDWFSFHKDETELEDKDQRVLEQCWARLHAAMPELGSQIEVIDTTTPRSYYELTRRKLGMVGGLPVTPARFWRHQPSYVTSLPNLFIVSDTTSPGGIAESLSQHFCWPTR